MFSSATAVFPGSLIGALIVKTTICPSGTTLANTALSPPTNRKATLSNRRRSFAGLSRATISRSIVSASIIGDFATLDICPPNSGGHESYVSYPLKPAHPPLQAGFRSL
jgi:hypothetical protein